MNFTRLEDVVSVILMRCLKSVSVTLAYVKRFVAEFPMPIVEWARLTWVKQCVHIELMLATVLVAFGSFRHLATSYVELANPHGICDTSASGLAGLFPWFISALKWNIISRHA